MEDVVEVVSVAVFPLYEKVEGISVSVSGRLFWIIDKFDMFVLLIRMDLVAQDVFEPLSPDIYSYL